MPTETPPIRIGLIAPDGRMGRAIAAAAEADGGFMFDADRPEVLVDFSAPAALPATLERARATRLPLLIGTTGLAPDADAPIEEAAREIAVLRAANTSLGVALLAELVERAARVLDPAWDIEIVEAHHRMKADAPSGTALALGEAAARGRGTPLAAERGRDGVGLSREAGAIGFAAVRGGTVAGDHDVMFLGAQERLILSHRAEDRSIFARGALAGARFLKGRAPGLYTMRDVVGAL
ncbi:4-hydroxy-tetrahydrodipicolinate reductase [Sphingomonas ginkgonis]|uniref:4-hydroxy-tetrahydrodipicolinate reductase n=1 Tax=Sphingomonas ginkgonis TaxID=2315330 RepID=A0A3R9YNV4_9SPHN|nr:4-hydroxy-tetrahydrodipicolinate reductase [Sphingomonas ginkgonis]RST31761.1 4-hydroxy-tetrahydrodipicolinate reductase [Sphingomonas ginkgonis]